MAFSFSQYRPSPAMIAAMKRRRKGIETPRAVPNLPKNMPNPWKSYTPRSQKPISPGSMGERGRKFLGPADKMRPNVSPLSKFFGRQKKEGYDFKITPRGNFGEYLRGAMKKRLLSRPQPKKGRSQYPYSTSDREMTKRRLA